jgi:hypothetical protein
MFFIKDQFNLRNMEGNLKSRNIEIEKTVLEEDNVYDWNPDLNCDLNESNENLRILWILQ